MVSSEALGTSDNTSIHVVEATTEESEKLKSAYEIRLVKVLGERTDVEEEANIFCAPKLLDMPRGVAVGILAHEFAHVFLGHARKGGLLDEHEVDALACQWGFTKEINAMWQHSGPPIDQKG